MKFETVQFWNSLKRMVQGEDLQVRVMHTVYNKLAKTISSIKVSDPRVFRRSPPLLMRLVTSFPVNLITSRVLLSETRNEDRETLIMQGEQPVERIHIFCHFGWKLVWYVLEIELPNIFYLETVNIISHITQNWCFWRERVFPNQQSL